MLVAYAIIGTTTRRLKSVLIWSRLAHVCFDPAFSSVDEAPNLKADLIA